MKLQIREIVIFGMLGALMYISKVLLEFLPNVHLIGVFIVASTVVYRRKALYPLYIFVFLTGLLSGFSDVYKRQALICRALFFSANVSRILAAAT